jgi:hypothetical protein
METPHTTRQVAVVTRRAVLELAGLQAGGGCALRAEAVLRRLPGVLRTYINPAIQDLMLFLHRPFTSPL